MDGFKRPKPQLRPPQPASVAITPAPLPTAEPGLPLDPLDIEPAGDPVVRKKRRLWLRILIGFILMLAIGAGAGLFWYNAQLQPVDPSDTSPRSVEVKSGDSISAVGLKLKSVNLIRNQLAFEIYARLAGANLKASTCRLTASQSVAQIVSKLEQGCTDFKVVTFFPGATIEKPLYKPAGATLDQTMYVKYRLANAGYTTGQVAGALSKTYSGPLFADKPASAGLEGYVFGETYYLKTDATAEDALQASFDQMYKVVQQNDLVAKFKAQDLNLYQGIIMASIVQRELNCEGKPTEERKQRCYGYEQTIAQVFLKRYHQGTTLGSDVTFIYAADMLGVAPAVNLDSPYNTRLYPGLPPGPIANPGELALKAVANPSNTDYMYFIAGDDGLIYFASTEAEHQANIKNHCQQLCGDL